MHPGMPSSHLMRDALHPPPARSTGPSLALSALVHVGLVAALALGVQWRRQSDVGAQAELWAAVPQSAAPPSEPPAHVPVATPPPPQTIAPKPPAATPERDADIALEQARKLKQEKARLEAEEKRARDKRQAEQDALEQAKADKARKDKQERERADQAKAEQDRKDKVAAKEKEQARAKEAAADAAREQARQDQLRRMQSQLGGTGGPQSNGNAPRDAGPSVGYTGRIVARIRPNIRLLDPINGNPEATVEVKVTPDGTIISRRLLKPSGNKVWDDAVLNAVDKTERLPRDTDGRIPPVFELKFTPQS